MQSSREYQGEIRGPSQVNNVNKLRKKEKRMGKTRDLFKKIRNTKGIFLETTGTIKDRNDKDLTEVEDIKNTWQEYTEKLYKKRS